MKKILLLTTVLSWSLLLTGCSNPAEVEEARADILDETLINNEKFVVSSDSTSNLDLYWNIESQNTKTYTSTIRWIVSELNAQIWSEVKKGDLIAKITPDYEDVSVKNIIVQRDSAQTQLVNLQNIKSSTVSNFDSQRQQLLLQKQSLETQLSTQEQNLLNLKKQKDIASDDIGIQKTSLESQFTKLQESKSLLEWNKEQTLKSINTSLLNLKWQIYVSVSQWFEYIDELFWITEDNETINDSFEEFLCAKDIVLKDSVLQSFHQLSTRFDWYNEMQYEEVTWFLTEFAELAKNSAKCVNLSIESNNFGSSTISTYYTEANTLADWLLKSKSSFDSNLDSLKTQELTFQSQIATVENSIIQVESSLNSIEKNSVTNSDLSYDSQINSSVAAVTSTKSALDSIQSQIDALNSSQSSQIKQLDNQISTISQTIKTLSNQLSVELIYAEFDGVIKSKNVDISNVLKSWDVIAEVYPVSDNSIKVVIFSPVKIALGTEFSYELDWKHIWTSVINYESPDKQTKTQNYVYEASVSWEWLKVWDRVDISLIQNISTDSEQTWAFWIPLEYVSPKLNGYFVKVQTEENFEYKQIFVWAMNWEKMEVVSWLSIWDILVR